MEDKYINIPYKILRRKDLSSTSKMVYGFANGFMEDYCQASNDYIGKVLGCSGRTIQRAVKELRDKKLIRVRIVTKDGKIKGRIINIK